MKIENLTTEQKNLPDEIKQRLKRLGRFLKIIKTLFKLKAIYKKSKKKKAYTYKNS